MKHFEKYWKNFRVIDELKYFSSISSGIPWTNANE